MSNLKKFYSVVTTFLLIGMAYNFQQSSASSTTALQLFTITPTISATLGPSFTVTPTSTSTPVPTLLPIDQEALELLNLEETYCAEVYAYQCHAMLKVKILDYLYQYPESRYRQQLINKMLEFGLWINPQWIIEEWLRETVLVQINSKPGAAEEFKKFETKWGQVFITDLDNNGEADYLITLRLQDLGCQTIGQMYWAYQANGHYPIKLLPTTMYDFEKESMYPVILSTDDLTGDGLPELTYLATTCGPSDQFQRPRILSWQDGQFIDRLIEQWYLTNGDLAIQEKNKNGAAKLIITEGQTGYPGVAPYSPYEVHLELQRGEYIPVKQNSLFHPDIQQREGDILYWQWVNFLLHTNHFIEAIDAFDTVAQQPSTFFEWVDYRPYALFRMGLTYILLDNKEAAQNSWNELVSKFPNHPVSLDMKALKDILKRKNDLGKACSWLEKNGGGWHQPQWAASERAIAFTKFQRYLNEEQGKMEYSQWVKSQEPIDYDQERKTLEYIDGPQGYGRLVGWEDFCHPMFLAPLYTWKQGATLEAQASQLGLVWQTLSAEFDLNNDGILDSIGVWETDEKLFLWSFISQGDIYQPLSVTQLYPLEAINIWKVTAYKYADRYFVPGESEFAVIDSDNNNLPEISAKGNYYEGDYKWIGHRFEYTPSARISPPAATRDLLTEALTILFRDRNPKRTLELLNEFTSSDDWEAATKLYFQAIALQYSNQPEQAQIIFERIVKDYPNTGWLLLAKEKLEFSISN